MAPKVRPPKQANKVYVGEEPVNTWLVESRMTDSGEGYTLGPHPEFDQPPETAQFEARINGKLVAVGVDDCGDGYETPPAVTITPAKGAACTAFIAGPVVSVEVSNGGSGYRCPPDVVFSEPGFPALASTTLTGSIESVEVAAEGSDLSESMQSRVLVHGGGGGGATVTVSIVEGKVVSATVQNGGSGYTSPPIVSCGNAILIPKMTYSVKSVTLSRGGCYTSKPSVTFEASGSVASISVNAKGSGYKSSPDVVVTGCGAGCSAFATLDDSERVDRVFLISPGRGYEPSSPPKVIFIGGGGSGATATATVEKVGSGGAATTKIRGIVTHVRVDRQGEFFRETPAISVTKPEGGRAAVLQGRIYGPVDKVEIVSGGKNYVEEELVGWPGAMPWERKNSGVRFINPSSMAIRYGIGHTVQHMGQSFSEDGEITEMKAPDQNVRHTTTNSNHPFSYLDLIAFANLPARYPCRPIAMPSYDGIGAGIFNFGSEVGLFASLIGSLGSLTPGASWNRTLDTRYSISSAQTLFELASTFMPLRGGCMYPDGRSFLGKDFPKDASRSWSDVNFKVGLVASECTVEGFAIPAADYPSADATGHQLPGEEVGDTGDLTIFPIWPTGIEFESGGEPKVKVYDFFGAGCEVSVNLNGSGGVASCSLDSTGSGYTSRMQAQIEGGVMKYSPPSISLTRGPGGSIVSATVDSPGSGFIEPPVAIVHGDNGRGAVISLSLQSGTGARGVASATVTPGGSGYSASAQVLVQPREVVFSKTTIGEAANATLRDTRALALAIKPTGPAYALPFVDFAESSYANFSQFVGSVDQLWFDSPGRVELFTRDSRLVDFRLNVSRRDGYTFGSLYGPYASSHYTTDAVAVTFAGEHVSEDNGFRTAAATATSPKYQFRKGNAVKRM
jgi:hypothetical protein